MQINISRQAFSRVILFVTIFCLLLMSFFSYRKIQNLIDFGRKIQHVQEMQTTLEKVFSSVKDAESGQRGFFITGDSTFLGQYTETDSLILSFKNRFDSLVEKKSIQAERIDTLMSLIHERMMILNYLLEMNKRIILPSAKEELNLVMKNGKDKMDEIRSVINRIQNTENYLLEQNRYEKDKLITLTPLFLLMLSFSAIALLLISFFALMSELKKRQEFEKELKSKIEELNRSNTDLEQFAYVASHDLQEPLRKIRSFSDRLVIKHKENLDDDGKSIIEKIQSAAGRLQILIEDLLSFSRLINNVRQTESTDLNKLLKLVLNDLEIALQNKNAKIHAGPLPTIKIVPSMIGQLFQNLIENSLKFSKSDVKPVISIASTTVKGSEITGISPERMNENFYKIEFNDNGIGFEEKYLDRIFVIFQRLHGKLEYGGTGIGLAVCKKIMLIHHGYIWATSTPGQGASFKLYFPVEQ